jgi:hypothetical protein
MKERIHNLFTEKTVQKPVFLPDMTLWYDFHSRLGSLPDKWKDLLLPEILGELGLPVWTTVCPWGIKSSLEVKKEYPEGGRSETFVTSFGDFKSHWTIGPDGDWWKDEYPVKTGEDLKAVLEIAESIEYVCKPELFDKAAKEAGAAGITAVELPMNPYSELLHNFLGWTEGLMYTFDFPDLIHEILNALGTKYNGLIGAIADLDTPFIYYPDNLDGMFISPPVFEEHLQPVYTTAADKLHSCGKYSIVHLGGMGRNLLAALSASGIDCIQGVSGPPQSDADFEAARHATGDGTVLWGGIPQDFVLSTHPVGELEKSMEDAFKFSEADPRIIIGIADKVVPQADLDRLKLIAERFK